MELQLGFSTGCLYKSGLKLREQLANELAKERDYILSVINGQQ